MKKFISTLLITFFIIELSTISIGYQTDSYIWWISPQSMPTAASQLPPNSTSNLAEKNTLSNPDNNSNYDANNNSENNNSLNLDCGSAVLMEQTTGQVLYSYNAHEKLRPASVTKIMSILLIMEQIDSGKLSYSDKISCSENARSMGGSQIWLDTKETLTVDEMLKAICVVSANDCVVAMAEHIAGSEEAFVQMMNDKAQKLGMNDTTFKNCHGIDEDGHETSSYDIALMSRELMLKHPDVKKYTTIWMDSLRNGKSQLVNTNKLIRTYKGITGLKTGSTSLALYNLSATATRDNLSLIAVVMKAPSTKLRFANAQKLLDYGFNNFTFKNFGNSGDIIQNIHVNKGIKSNIDLVLENSSGALIEKGKENEVSQSIEINNNIEAPIKKGDVLGKVVFTLKDGNQISSTNLIASENIDKINFKNMVKKIIKNWISLLRL